MITKTQAIEIGGKVWKDKRIYFNGSALEKLYGIKVVKYASGQPKAAWDKDGDKMSNADAWKALGSKPYYDIDTDSIIDAVRETI